MTVQYLRPRLSHTEVVDWFDIGAAGPADAGIGVEPRCSQDSQGERRTAVVAAAAVEHMDSLATAAGDA